MLANIELNCVGEEVDWKKWEGVFAGRGWKCENLEI